MILHDLPGLSTVSLSVNFQPFSTRTVTCVLACFNSSIFTATFSHAYFFHCGGRHYFIPSSIFFPIQAILRLLRGFIIQLEDAGLRAPSGNGSEEGRR